VRETLALFALLSRAHELLRPPAGPRAAAAAAPDPAAWRDDADQVGRGVSD
jgi:hypothetical protein